MKNIQIQIGQTACHKPSLSCVWTDGFLGSWHFLKDSLLDYFFVTILDDTSDGIPLDSLKAWKR